MQIKPKLSLDKVLKSFSSISQQLEQFSVQCISEIEETEKKITNLNTQLSTLNTEKEQAEAAAKAIEALLGGKVNE